MIRQHLVFALLILLSLFATGCAPASGDPVQTAATPLEATVPATAAVVEPEEAMVSLAPREVTEAFYAWYLDLIGDRSEGEFHNPLVEGTYKESPFLTSRFVRQIEESLAVSDGRGGFDPFLLAQDIPVAIEVQDAAPGQDETTLVVLRTWGGNPEPSPMVVHLVQEEGAWRIDNVTPFEVPPAPEAATAATSAEMGPVEKVEAYFAWYGDQVGDDLMRLEHNPLVSGSYRQAGFLSPRLIAEIDAYAASSNPYGYDPLVMAIQPPSEVQVGEAVVEGETAVVSLERTWPGIDSWLPMRVILRPKEGRWLIDDLTIVVEGEPALEESPAAAVEAFYTWALAYTGSPAQGEFRNMLVDGAYRESPYLTEELVTAVDAQLAQTRALQLSGSDPFLCAQNFPLSLAIGPTFVQPDGAGSELARVLVRTGFTGPHYLVVTLRPSAGGWRLDEIGCANSSTARAAEGFYTWYLGSIGDRRESFRNLLAEGAYQDAPFLSEACVARVEEFLRGAEGGGYDPFLQAQDIPQGFSVTPGPGENEALVDFTFFGEDGRSYGGWRALVTGAESGWHWQLEDVRGQDLPEVARFANEGYGFSFLHPAAWLVQEMDYSGPGMPDDWPVVAGYQVMPPEVAEQMAAQTAPDPLAPPIVAPFQIEIVSGDQADLARAFLPLEEGQIESLGRKMAFVYALEPGYSQFVFPHPYRLDTWIVVTDWVTGFPGREAQAEAAAAAREMLINGLVFEK